MEEKTLKKRLVAEIEGYGMLEFLVNSVPLGLIFVTE
jgi:hypothetical protein